MAIEFKYYLRGSNIALLEKTADSREYNSPSTDISNGLMLEYSAMPTIPDDETDAIDLSEELCLAAVEYVKAKFAENEQQYDKRDFHMREFKRMVYQYQKNRFGGLRKMMPQNPFAMR